MENYNLNVYSYSPDSSTINLLDPLLQSVFGSVQSLDYASLSLASLLDSVPLFVRAEDSSSPALPSLLKYFGVEYLYYLDDNLWLLDESVSSEYQNYNCNDRLASIDQFLAYSSGVYPSSEYFCKYLRDRFPSVSIHYIPPPIHPSSVRSSPSIPRHSSYAHGEYDLILGYAGSHKPDDVRPVYQSVCYINHNTNIKVLLCLMDGVSKSVDNENVLSHPYVHSINEYYAKLSSFEWDIGIAPLRGDVEFLKHKTDNKFRDYTMAGMATFATNTPPYSTSILHMATGYLVKSNTVEEWIKAIQWAARNRHTLVDFVRNARAQLLKRNSLDYIVSQWKEKTRNLSPVGRRVDRVRLSELALDLLKFAFVAGIRKSDRRLLCRADIFKLLSLQDFLDLRDFLRSHFDPDLYSFANGLQALGKGNGTLCDQFFARGMYRLDSLTPGRHYIHHYLCDRAEPSIEHPTE